MKRPVNNFGINEYKEFTPNMKKGKSKDFGNVKDNFQEHLSVI